MVGETDTPSYATTSMEVVERKADGITMNRKQSPLGTEGQEKMATEYIEKQTAIKELCETYEHEYPTASGAFDEYATRIVPNVLRNLPPADVRPVVRGKWVWLSSTYDRIPCEMRYWCSICHHETILHSNEMSHPWERFCPNCGADMRGGDAE